jgi:hypothetical protein
VGRVGAELKWFGAELKWNFEISGWSWSGVGVDAFFNSDSTPIDSFVELIFQVYITLLHKNNKPANH